MFLAQLTLILMVDLNDSDGRIVYSVHMFVTIPGLICYWNQDTQNAGVGDSAFLRAAGKKKEN